jgi:uncharacterized protein YecT (DUF1311 family)
MKIKKQMYKNYKSSSTSKPLMKSIFFWFFILMISFVGFSQSQAEMNLEARQEYEKSDLQLNEVYKNMLSMLGGNEKTLFIQSEREWIKFRDAQCNFESEQYAGGSIQPLINYSCLKSLTDERINQIQILMEER